MISRIKEIFRLRQLILSLALKDLKVKYRQASCGFGWMFINPLVQTGLFTFIFSFIFKIGIKNYPLFLLSGLFPWAYLASVVNDASMCIINNSNLIKKTYFPRETLPLSVVLTQSIIFSFPLLILSIFSFINNPELITFYIWLPVVVIVQMMLLTGLALAVSALNVHYRDVSFIINVLLMAGFYAAPIVYPVDMVKNLLPQELMRLYLANPITGIIVAYQNIFFYIQPPDILSILSLFLVSLLILGLGFWIFHKYEASFEELL